MYNTACVPPGEVAVTTEGDYHKITSNAIPDHTTGTFPGTGNPNTVVSSNVNYRYDYAL